MRPLIGYVLIALSVCGFACGSGEPLRVTEIQLGRSRNADKTVGNHTTRFAPGDTVYLAVVTTGSGAGTIGVKWMYGGGRVLGEPRKPVEYTGTAVTDFELKSAAGFWPGDYTAEVFLDGKSAGTRPFRVEAER